LIAARKRDAAGPGDDGKDLARLRTGADCRLGSRYHPRPITWDSTMPRAPAKFLRTGLFRRGNIDFRRV